MIEAIVDQIQRGDEDHPIRPLGWDTLTLIK
jgi:hypothetical protein